MIIIQIIIIITFIVVGQVKFLRKCVKKIPTGCKHVMGRCMTTNLFLHTHALLPDTLLSGVTVVESNPLAHLEF